MENIIEISDLDLNGGGSMKSSNFGGGLELLMNEKVKEGSKKVQSDINIEDLNNLESELNQLADETININLSEGYQPKSDLFGSSSESSSSSSSAFSGSYGGEKHSVRFDDSSSSSSGFGLGSSATEKEPKTWDGYGKFNNVPLNPDQTGESTSKQPQLSKEEMLREKFKYLKKLEALEKKGVELSKKYTMESSLLEMQGEYETIMEEKAKQNSVKFQGNMMMAVINGIEFLNGRFDPFDIKLDGWGEQINENITDYDEIFGELYEKYKSKASMAPELKLLFQLGGSAMMVHMTNTMFKSAMPGMDDILRQNPDLMRQFQSAAVNSMGQSNPGFAGFMNGIMDPPPGQSMGMGSMGMGGPPPPMATQGPKAPPPSRDRPGNNSSSSASFSRGGPGTSFVSGFKNQNDGINIKENFSDMNEKPERTMRRPEMRGPSDITDILSGLKTKTINIQESSSSAASFEQEAGMSSKNESSTISISDLKDLQENGTMPKKSKRKPKSDKNTVSLDI
jgi:hypothetical protein